jgi:hypothetical protein
MIHFGTNAPFAPWARVTPSVLGISWFIRTVRCVPLSYAPGPSGMPPTSGAADRVPVVRTLLVTTPDWMRTKYGVTPDSTDLAQFREQRRLRSPR